MEAWGAGGLTAHYQEVKTAIALQMNMHLTDARLAFDIELWEERAGVQLEPSTDLPAPSPVEGPSFERVSPARRIEDGARLFVRRVPGRVAGRDSSFSEALKRSVERAQWEEAELGRRRVAIATGAASSGGKKGKKSEAAAAATTKLGMEEAVMQAFMDVSSLGPSSSRRPSSSAPRAASRKTRKCPRCGKKGHVLRMCPTLADARFNRTATSASGVPAAHLEKIVPLFTECGHAYTTGPETLVKKDGAFFRVLPEAARKRKGSRNPKGTQAELERQFVLRAKGIAAASRRAEQARRFEERLRQGVFPAGVWEPEPP